MIKMKKARKPKTATTTNIFLKWANKRSKERTNERVNKRIPNTNQTLTHSQRCMGHFHEFSELYADDGFFFFIFIFIFWRDSSEAIHIMLIMSLLLDSIGASPSDFIGIAAMALLFSSKHTIHAFVCVFVSCSYITCHILAKDRYFRGFFPKTNTIARKLIYIKRVELLHAQYRHTHTHTHIVADNASIVVMHFHSVEQYVHHSMHNYMNVYAV